MVYGSIFGIIKIPHNFIKAKVFQYKNVKVAPSKVFATINDITNTAINNVRPTASEKQVSSCTAVEDVGTITCNYGVIAAAGRDMELFDT